jgi:uncharacterized protein
MPEHAVSPVVLVIVGVCVGIYSGIMGLGGGTIMIPVLVLLLGFDQHRAVGTSLAVMIPPVTLPAVIAYYREGRVDLSVAMWIAVGVLCGAYAGGWFANRLSKNAMQMTFGFVLIYVAGYTLFNTLGRQHLVRSMTFAGVMVLAAALFFGVVKWNDARNARQPAAARN